MSKMQHTSPGSPLRVDPPSFVTDGLPVLIGAPLIGLVVCVVLLAAGRRWAHRRSHALTRRMLAKTTPPLASLGLLSGLAIGLSVVSGSAPWSDGVHGWLSDMVRSVTALAVAWVVIGVIGGVHDIMLARYRTDTRDNLRARRMHTRITVISRVLMIVAGIVGLAVSLMAFDSVERLGASLLASAGIAGIVLGFAARPVLGNLLAGIQIALTQPIRLDDAVVIDGEWGWIEEITATYVVLRIWDQRRLIVPFSRIIEQPFQNWTRTTAEILGAIELHADYTCPVPEVRAELGRLVAAHPAWDGRVAVLQVTDATPTTIVLRALVSAGDSPSAWDLRCDVREGLLRFLGERGTLPRTRVEMAASGGVQAAPAGSSAGA